jgi:hypothetical protein
MTGNTLEKLLAGNPLIRYSIYTQIQFQSLKLVREKLRALKPIRTGPDEYRAENFPEYNALFWLWTLGAFECLRTMGQHKDCFESPLQDKLKEMKNKVALLRVPFAKQELKGEKTFQKPSEFYDENSVTGVETGYVFTIGGKRIDSEVLMDEVISFFENIKQTDILQPMPVAQRPRANHAAPPHPTG